MQTDTNHFGTRRYAVLASYVVCRIKIPALLEKLRLKSRLGTIKSLRHAVTKAYVVQSTIGRHEDSRFNRSPC